MNVLMAGEGAIHLRNYCKAIRPYLGSLSVISETEVDIPEADASHVVSLRSMNPLVWWKAQRRIKTILATDPPDLVHLHQINRLALLVCHAAVSLGIPVITTAWGSDVLLVPYRNRIFRYFTTRVLQRSEIVTADAQVMIDSMLALDATPGKYVLLQYGIDPILPVEKEKLIYSNRLHRPLYNIDTVIRDFSDFHHRHPDWKLVVGATGPETDNLKALVHEKKLDHAVEFTGWLNKEQNDANYAKAAIYVSIPDSDGTSVSLLEALSADCIPVVSDLPVSHEWIQDGVNGVIRKAGQSALEEALKLDRNSCLEYNRNLINSKVDRKYTTRRFFELYQSVLSPK